MRIRVAKKSRRKETDRISLLPDHLIQKILSYLPLKEIVRTGTLSSKWRFHWANIPKLAFNEECCPPTRNVIDRSFSRSKKLIRIIDQVLLLHTAPITAFHLEDLRSVPDIDRWILHLSRNPISELVLQVSDGPCYKLPSSLYACSSLMHLNLRQCALRRPPSSFNGFKCLKRLILWQTTLTQHTFENLVSSCPLLAKLIVINCVNLSNIKINAPNLECIDIEGLFKAITFGSVHLKLSEVSVDLKDNIPTEYDADHDGESCMTQFFTCIPNIKRLEVKYYFLKHLAVGLIPERLPTPFLYLYHVSICINLNDVDESLAALCLLRSSPNLKELEIQGCVVADEFYMNEESSVWADERNCNCSFEQLRSVKLVDVSGTSLELEFVKFLLVNSFALEMMTISPYLEHLSSNFLKDMLRFRRASTRAEIVILDP